MARIELVGVAKSYGGHSVVENLDLDVADGSFTVFVGPSGCGKSTLLRMIAGLEEITDGVLRIDGIRANDATPNQRGIAMVFQNYALYPHMTVAENIGFGLKMAGISAKDVRARVDAAARSLHIEPLLDRRPSALSGGQCQRVAIGRAIVRDPTVFLFDEPLSNLDAELRVIMRVEIAKLHRQLGATMIYVTHDQVEAMTLADRIVVLRAGKIEQAGAPEELYASPVNTFVAGFIGSPRMNFLRGRGTSDGQVQVDDGPEIKVEGTSPRPNEPVSIGLRPEHLLDPQEGLPTLEMKVDVVENLGGTHFVYGTLPSGETIVAEARTVRRHREGETASFGFQPSSAHLFSEDGSRLGT